MARVWESSQQKGSALLLLLAIADHAHDDGTGAWPSQTTLARKTRLSARQVRRLVATLEARGELRVAKRAGTTDLLTVLVGADKLSSLSTGPTTTDDRTTPDIAVTATPDTLATTPDTAVSDEPSLEPSSTVRGTGTSEDGAAAPPLRGDEETRGRAEEDVTYVLGAYLECGGAATDYARFKVAKEAEKLLREGHGREEVACAARVLGSTRREPWELRGFVAMAGSVAVI